MSKLLAQHGSAKGQKIIDGLLHNNLSGAVFSLNDEVIDSILKHIKSSTVFNKDNMYLDPQFYYSTFNKEILKKLDDVEKFPLEITRRDWRNKNPKILGFLEQHANYTKELSNMLITPGFYINNIDWHFDYSVDIYKYCIQNYTFDSYALSLLISISFFNNKKNVEEMLEELEETVPNKNYIYLTVCYENSTENNYEIVDIDSLSNLMSFIHQLKKLGFKFIVGYSFMNSILFAMLDCEYIASGWFNTLRKFSKNKFEITDNFGRRKKRYTSLPLLSYIMFDDLAIMIDTGVINKESVTSGSSYDERFINDENSLSFVDLEHEYWETLKIMFVQLDSITDIKGKIEYVQESINKAINIYQKVCQQLDVLGEQESLRRIKMNAKHLFIWQTAIELFKDNEVIL